MENPNHSNARYAEKNNEQIKSSAFASKKGYSGKMKAKESKMPMPSHMSKKDCY